MSQETKEENARSRYVAARRSSRAALTEFRKAWMLKVHMATEAAMKRVPEDLTIQEATAHVTKAQAAFVYHHTFFASLLGDLGDLVFTEDVPTAATDGFCIYINPVWVGKLTHENIIFVLAHEIMHVVLLHCQRFKAYIDRGYVVDDLPLDFRTANIAADAIINCGLVEDRVGVMPEEGVLHEDITSEHSFEEAYRIVYEREQQGGGGHDGEGFDAHFEPSNEPGNKPKGKGAVERAMVLAANAAKAAELVRPVSRCVWISSL